MSDTAVIDTDVMDSRDAATNRLPNQRRAHEVFPMCSPISVISAQVTVEPHTILTRKLGISEENAEDILRLLDVKTVSTGQKMAFTAARTCVKHQISMRDTLIFKGARTAGCSKLCGRSNFWAMLRGLVIVSPFLLNLADPTSNECPRRGIKSCLATLLNTNQRFRRRQNVVVVQV